MEGLPAEAPILSPRQRGIKLLGAGKTRLITLYPNVIKSSVYRAIYMNCLQNLLLEITCEAAPRLHPNQLHLQAYEEPFRRSEQMDESGDRCASAQGCVQTNLLYELL